LWPRLLDSLAIEMVVIITLRHPTQEGNTIRPMDKQPVIMEEWSGISMEDKLIQEILTKTI
jgi:hypothetical protein